MRNKMLKRVTAVAAATMMTFLAMVPGTKITHAQGNDDVIKLRVCNWEEYIDLGDWDEEERMDLENGAEIFGENSMVDDFTVWYYETYGKRVEVEYSCFGTNEDLYNQLTLGDVYDLVCPSDYMIQKMRENDLLAELNFDNIPNIDQIDPAYMEMSQAFDPENKYSVPYCWGTVGILYNTKLLDELGVPAPTKWADLWDERLSGEILMQDSVRDAFMVALKKDGYSMNSESKDELEQAKQELIDQKPLVQAYVIDQVRDKMIGGEAAVGVIYSGEMLYIQDEAVSLGLDYDLEYVIPEEGTNLWLDSWVIPKNAKNKENAEKWIDFMCRPEIAKANFEYITYPTPNKGAFELLDEDMQNNKAVFPDIDSLKDSEVYQYLGDDTDAIYNELWKEVKAN